MSVSRFGDLSVAFYHLFDPPAQEIDPTCCICLENCDKENERVMACPPNGALKEHFAHENCQRNWAQAKREGGVSDDKIRCQYNGVCKTNLAYLLSRKSFWEKTSDFFRDRPPVQVLTVSATILAMRGVISLIAPPASSREGEIAQVAVNILNVLAPAGIAAWKKREEVASSGFAVLAGAYGAMREKDERTGGLSMMLGIDSIMMSFLAGMFLTGIWNAPKNFISTAAATAGVVCASTLINGGSWVVAGGLSALSALGSCYGHVKNR